MSRRIAVALATCGALVVLPHALPAQAASTQDAPASVAAAARPPAGKAWLVGVITDQAGHALQNVNVEALSTEPGSTEPVASDLTYENVVDGKQGYFRLEVPIHATYRIVASADPDDPYRTFQYKDGDPIKVGLRKVRQLGTSEIARVALQSSTTTAKLKPGTVKVNKAAKVTVTVACKNVDPVLGKVTAAVGGKKVAATMKRSDHGTTVLTLPKLKKAGKYTVEVWYLGDSYVKKSTTKQKLTLIVKK